VFRLAGLIFLAGAVLQAHDFYSTKITWSREIARIVAARCLSCHQEGGKAFSLATFEEARPWAKAIKEEVLYRRMPPWGAVKGFGEFRNDTSLTQEEISLISDWVEGGAPEGEKNYLPDMHGHGPAPAQGALPGRSQTFSGAYQLSGPAAVLAIAPKQLSSPAQVTAELPDGSLLPMIWILTPQIALGREFQYESPIMLPKGTRLIAPQGSWRIVLR
jgi:hypothetical protein